MMLKSNKRRVLNKEGFFCRIGVCRGGGMIEVVKKFLFGKKGYLRDVGFMQNCGKVLVVRGLV